MEQLDALYPASESASASISSPNSSLTSILTAMAEAADKGAKETTNMRARFGTLTITM